MSVKDMMRSDLGCCKTTLRLNLAFVSNNSYSESSRGCGKGNNDTFQCNEN
jgi:hypothetical protein